MTDHDRAADRAPESGAADPLALPQVAAMLPDISTLRSHGGPDLDVHIERLARLSKQRPEQEAAARSLLMLPHHAVPGEEDSLALGKDGEDLLEDACANIDQGEYALALEQLAEFLVISPEHAEARYLQAYCHYRLGGEGLMTAMAILRPMRDEPLEDRETRARVRELRTEMRAELTPREMAAFLSGLSRDPDGTADRLRRYIELAPEEPQPPYLLATTQARDGRFEAALRTALAGLREAEGDTAELRGLVDALMAKVVRPLAGPALRALRQGGYARARRELAKVSGEWRQTEVLRDLDGFLHDLIRGSHPHTKPLPAPRLTADRTARLYGLIADEDAGEAVDLLLDGRFADAERVAAGIIRLVPRYPAVSYLYAICLLVQGRKPEQAVVAAEIAVRDPSLPDVEALLVRVREMREILIIQAVLDEHNDAVKAVPEEPTVQDFTALQRTMESLRRRIPELRKEATIPRAREVVRDLGKSIERHLQEIERAIPTIQVNELVRRFNRAAGQLTTMRSRLGPYGDRDGEPYDPSFGRYSYPGGTAGSARTEMEELLGIEREARRLYSATSDPRARQVLQDMLSAIDLICAAR